MTLHKKAINAHSNSSAACAKKRVCTNTELGTQWHLTYDERVAVSCLKKNTRPGERAREREKKQKWMRNN